jgi:hypothetical protein
MLQVYSPEFWDKDFHSLSLVAALVECALVPGSVRQCYTICIKVHIWIPILFHG